MRIRRILIAVDRSPLAAHAAEIGLELARSLKGEVAFVHAVDSDLGFAPDTGLLPGEILALAKRDGGKLLTELRDRATIQPPPVEFLVLGDPGHEIVKVAKEWPADLLVTGSHGRGGVSRLVLGSVAEYVMRHAPCPVLVVRKVPEGIPE